MAYRYLPKALVPPVSANRYPTFQTAPRTESKPTSLLCLWSTLISVRVCALIDLTLESDWFSTWCQILYTIISSWERLIGDWFSLSLAMTDKTLFTLLLFSALMAEWTMKSNILSSGRISKRKSCVIWTYILILLSESNDFVICASGSLLRKGRGWRTAGLSWSWDASSRLRESWTATGPGSTEQVGSVFGS